MAVQQVILDAAYKPFGPSWGLSRYDRRHLQMIAEERQFALRREQAKRKQRLAYIELRTLIDNHVIEQLGHRGAIALLRDTKALMSDGSDQDYRLWVFQLCPERLEMRISASRLDISHCVARCRQGTSVGVR